MPVIPLAQSAGASPSLGTGRQSESQKSSGAHQVPEELQAPISSHGRPR